MVGFQVFADTRENTAQTTTVFKNFRALTVQVVHICGRAAEIRNSAGKARDLIADFFNLIDHRFLRAALNNPPLVLGN